MRDPVSGRFVRNEEKINIWDLLSVLYKFFPILLLLLVLYSHFDISLIIRKALVEFLCGKKMELCNFVDKENGGKSGW